MTDDLFTIAEKLRDRGMSLAVAAQDRKVPGWSDLAYAAIVRIAERQEFVHVDNVLAEFPLRPKHYNAWGQPWQRAIKNGILQATGKVKPSSDPAKHKHLYVIYRSRIYRRKSA